MADEDIYNNKRKYLRLMESLDQLTLPPATPTRRGQRRYHCRNASNLEHFWKLHQRFESRDTSYVRRNRILHVLLFLTAHTDKDLAMCDRDDLDHLVARAHQVNRTPVSKTDFLKSTKWIWRTLFPETDEKGRVDDGITPYPVRHLSCRVDKSRETLRNDRLTPDELERLIVFFSSKPQMQAYISLAFESLGRPQEVCYTRIKDVELHENYARVWVSSHGKEGAKFLHCIDAYPYLVKWYSQHPFQRDKDAFLFFARSDSDRPLTPGNINKQLRHACAKLGIQKTITAYSLKRNGVTFRRLRGDSDVEIQHVAGWTSTKQLQTYDLSTPEDAFRQQLARRGLLPDSERPGTRRDTKQCICGAQVGFADDVCQRCKRTTDTSRIKDEFLAEQEIRQILAAALQNPDKSLAKIMEKCRRRVVESGHRTVHHRVRMGPRDDQRRIR